MTLLKVRGVGKSFGGVQALQSVDLHVEQGETLGLMGSNGAGKTTLFSIIAGHVRPSVGEVWFKNRSIRRLRPDKVCRLGIARTFQIVRPFAGLTVRDNVEVAILFGSGSRDYGEALSERALRVLAEVGLEDRANSLAATLTLSARKRLEVARAIATDPELLLLDEVMAGLTPREGEEMIELINQIKLRRPLSIVVVEHVVKALTTLSDRIVVLHQGEIIVDGLPGEVIHHPIVRAAYFGEG